MGRESECLTEAETIALEFISSTVNSTEDETEQQDIEYDPMVVEMNDGGMIIGDVTEFMIDTKSCAAHIRDGQLYVLRSDTLKWMSIEQVREADAPPKPAAKKSGKVTPLRKTS